MATDVRNSPNTPPCLIATHKRELHGFSVHTAHFIEQYVCTNTHPKCYCQNASEHYLKISLYSSYCYTKGLILDSSDNCLIQGHSLGHEGLAHAGILNIVRMTTPE